MVSASGRRKGALAVVFSLAALLTAPGWFPARGALAAWRPALLTHRYAVATDNAEASRAAAEVLHAGGSAADGAIAAVLALGVAGPSSSGLGGGGFATVCTPQGACTVLDFRETAPAALTVAALSRPRASVVGGLAVGVPGEPAGLLSLSQRWGHLPLARVVAPAAALARQGAVVTPFIVDRVVGERAELAANPALSALFLPGGVPVVAGARLRRPRLASTIERFGREGERFVQGAFAHGVFTAVRDAGGVLTEDEVAHYRVQERAAFTRTFRGYTLAMAPVPSAGGAVLAHALAWADAAGTALPPQGSSAYFHMLADAFRHGFDDRARYLGEQGGEPLERLLTPERLAQRHAGFDPAHARPVVVVEPARDAGTTHVCVIDAAGMVVSLTTSVNLSFGARFTAPELDVVLNDTVDDFSLPTGGNFGLASARPNALASGARPVSSMTPVVVLRDGHPVGCVGAGGGPRIATAVTQTLLNLLAFDLDPEAAVSAPRMHHQGVPAQVLVEREVSEDVRIGLRARGYEVAESPVGLAVVQALWVRTRNGQREVLAASDPRKNGLPAGE